MKTDDYKRGFDRGFDKGYYSGVGAVIFLGGFCLGVYGFLPILLSLAFMIGGAISFLVGVIE